MLYNLYLRSLTKRIVSNDTQHHFKGFYLLLLLTVLTFGAIQSNAQSSIWSNPITGTNPNTSNPYTTGDVVVSNLTVSGISRGGGLTGVNNNNRYTVSGLQSAAMNSSDYFQFTLTPAAGYALNLSGFTYTGQISTGNASFSFRSSLDAFGSPIGTPSAAGTTISLSSSIYQNLTTAITFRLYLWNAAAEGTTYSINDFDFTSSDVAVSSISSFSPTSACSGSNSSVTITGVNLSSTTSVKFNNVSASFVVNSGTSVTATLPSTATTGVISLTTASGTISSATSFTVNAMPSPTFFALAGTTVCGNTNVVYTTQSGQSNYVWSIPYVQGTDYLISSGSTASTSSSVTLKWFSGGNKAISVNYSNSAGCSAASAVTSPVILVDNTPPVITCGSNITGNAVADGCGYTVHASNPTASDNCSVSKLTWTMSGATVASSPSTGINTIGNYTFNTGVTTITYTASDAAFNTATCQFTVTVLDTQIPTITTPATQTGALNSSCIGTLGDYRSLVTVSDNCTSPTSIVISQSPAPGTTLTGAGVILVTLNATEASGNIKSSSFQVNKIETSIPTMIVPANITATSTIGMCGSIVNYTLGVNDNCSVGPCAPPSISGFTLIGTLNGHTYFRSNASYLPAAIAAVVTPTGGHLASVSNATENAFLNGIGSHYIGFNDVATEGTFIWTSGEPVSYTNWNPFEPNDSGGEDWTAINWGGSTFWNDYASALPIILEFDCSYNMMAGFASGSFFPIGTTAVTYSVTDGSGNVSQPASFNVIVNDVVAPTLTCPATVNASTGVGNTLCTVPVNYPLPTAIDNCGSCLTAPAIAGFVSLGIYQGSAYYLSNASVPFATAVASAVGVGGVISSIGSAGENSFIRNAATAVGAGSYMIGFTDQTIEGTFVWSNGQPVTYTNWYSGEPNNVNNEDYTQVYTNGAWNDMSGISRFVIEVICTPVALSSGPASGGSFSVGTTAVTYSATDASGNVGTCSFNVVVSDNTIPTIICPGSQTLALGAGCAGILGDYRSLATVSDNCTIPGSLIVTQSPSVGSAVSGVGTTVVTLTVADGAGNTANCTFNVMKVDTTNPTITCPANINVNAISGGCTASVLTANPVFADNCSVTKLTWALTGATIAASATTGLNYVGTRIFNSGVTTITYTAKDAANNGQTCTFTVSVNETTNPVITCPGAQTLSLNGSGPTLFPDYRSLATVSDNCTATGAIIISQSPAAGSTVSGIGTTLTTLTATDASGNQSSCTFNVNRVDVSPPLAFCQNVTIPLAANGTAVITAASVNNGSSDNIGITSMSVNPNTFTCSGSGETIVHSSDGYAVHINVVPVMINPASLSCQFGYSYTIGLTYNISFTGSNIPSNLYTLQGAVTVNGSDIFYDLPNNGGTGSTISSSSYTNNTNCATVTPAALGITSVKVVIDGPGITSQTVTINTSNQVVLTVTDASGNSSTCSATVTVLDNLPPTVVCPTNMTVNTTSGNCNATVSTPNPVITDNCTVNKITWVMSGATTANSPATGLNYVGSYTFNVGTTSISYTAVDNSGNTQTNSFNVIVQNTTAPNVACPASQTLIHSATCTTELPDYRLLVNLSDDCTPTTNLQIVQAPAPGTPVTGVGTTTVNFLVTDQSGNSNTCLFIVQHVDNILPVITCPGDQSINLDQNGAGVIGNYKPLMLGTDACNTPLQIVYTQIPPLGTIVNEAGSTLITMYGADLSGNTAECTFSVLAIDNIAPEITCPSSQQLILGSDNSAMIPDCTSIAMIADNVSTGTALLVTQTPAAGTSVSGAGIIPISLTVTDQSGNSDVCTFDMIKIVQTSVSFEITGTTVNENSGDIQVAVSISNPSTLIASQVDLVIVSGDATRVNNFSSQTINFPVGSNTQQLVTIHITNNTLCDVLSELTFGLQNATGGNSIVIGTSATYALSLSDDEIINAVSLNDNVEDGIIADWIQPTSSQWSASSAASLTGGYSIKHALTSGNGQSALGFDLHKLPVSGVTTEWKFNLSHYNQEPNQNDLFFVYLAANSSDINSAACSGYAIGVNPSNGSDPDIIKLWRMANGVPVQEIISTGYDLGVADNQIGWKITRSESGEWKVYLDADGGFNNLQLSGTGNDHQITRADYFGLYYRYTNSTAGKLAIDDISITQTACSCTYYSQGSGSVSDVLWSTATIGTPVAKESSKYSNYVVQQGHTVSLSNTMYTKNVQVAASGVLNIGSNELTVYGEMNVNGTLNAGTGVISFRGDIDQPITGSTSLTLNNVEIENIGQHVILNPVNETLLKGVATIKQGILVTNDQLVLISNPTTNGSVGTIYDGADLTGKITMQRFVPALTNYPNGGYVGLGCAVQGATLADWNDDIITTGFIGSDYPPPYSFNNISWYNESVAGNFNAGYVPATNITNPLYSDRGYFVFTQTGVQNLEVKGDIYKHDFNKALSYTNTGSPANDGYNLMVNQYPSEVDFKMMANNGSGVSSYSVFDAETNNYKAYNAVTNSGNATRYIAASQSFFVKVSTANAFMKYLEIYKTHNGVSFEREDEVVEVQSSQVVFKIVSENLSADQAVLVFYDGATPQFDEQYDVPKINSPSDEAVACALVSSDNQFLTIDTREDLQEDLHIPIHVKLPQAGNYIFSIESLLNLTFVGCVCVEDLLTGNVIRLESGQTLTLNTTEAYEGNRLVIRAIESAAHTEHNVSCHGQNTGSIEFQEIDPSGILTVTDITQHVVYVGPAIPMISGLGAGDYTVMIEFPESHCQAEAHEIHISEPLPVSVTLNSSVPGDCNEGNTAELSVEIENATDYSYRFLNSSDAVVFAGTSSEAQLLLNNIPSDVYTVLIDGQCGSQSIIADLRDPNAVKALILSDDIFVTIVKGSHQLLTVEQDSDNADYFEWKLGDSFSSNDEQFNYTFTTKGDYELSLKASNDECDDEKRIKIFVDQALSEGTDGFIPVSIILSKEYMMFSVNQTLEDDLHLSIYDVSGRILWSFTTQSQEGKRIETGIAHYAPGIYFVKGVVAGHEVLNKKIMK